VALTYTYEPPGTLISIATAIVVAIAFFIVFVVGLWNTFNFNDVSQAHVQAAVSAIS
jgi:hypothetical protein